MTIYVKMPRESFFVGCVLNVSAFIYTCKKIFLSYDIVDMINKDFIFVILHHAHAGEY